MNTLLKVLMALALITCIVAGGLHIMKMIDSVPENEKDVRSETPAPTTSQIISTGAVPELTIKPIEIKADNPLQPSYRPINQPSYIQFLRQEGKVYHSRIAGKVTGQASKKDWGIKGTAYFEYIYAVESTGKIVKNDGLTIIEQRKFGKVQENLIASGYEIRVELPEQLGIVFETLESFGGKIGTVGTVAKGITDVVNNVQLPVSKSLVDAARQAGFFSKLPDLDPQRFEQEIKLFTQGPDNRLLEGKTVEIIFREGVGVASIIPIECGLTQREEDVIVRTNFVMDHYLFPDRKVEPGADWQVDGSVFAGFLDPRLNGKVGGHVTVMRTPDFVDVDGKVSKKLKVVNGQIVVTDEAATSNITGQITGLRGVCVLPDDHGIVTSAQLHGYAEYRNVSRDHLLFESQTLLKPKIEVRYECAVE